MKIGKIDKEYSEQKEQLERKGKKDRETHLRDATQRSFYDDQTEVYIEKAFDQFALVLYRTVLSWIDRYGTVRYGTALVPYGTLGYFTFSNFPSIGNENI